MQPLDARAVDENLAQRLGQGQFVNSLGIELERHVFLGPPTGRRLKEIGAEGRVHDVEETAQNTVFVGADHGIQAASQASLDAFHRCLSALGLGGIEQGHEKIDDQLRQGPVVGKGLFHIGLGKGDAGLAQVLGVRPEDHHLAPGHAGERHQRVEAVAFGFAQPNAAERVLEIIADAVRVDVRAVLGCQPEVVDHHFAVAVFSEHHVVGRFVNHLEAHVLEQRQHIRKRYRPVRVIDHEADMAPGRAGPAVEAHADFARRQHLFDFNDVNQRLGDAVFLAIAGPEGVPIALQQFPAPFFAVFFHQRIQEPVLP